MSQGVAWQARRFGVPEEVLMLEQEVLTAPRPGQVLIRVVAVGIGLPDLNIVGGRFPGLSHPPVMPGQEVAGEVIAVAPGSNYACGDRIMGLTPFMQGRGGAAEFTYVNEAKSARVPAGIDAVSAAGFPIAFRTAYAAMVERTPIEAGQNVIVLGAAGGTGSAAIILAKALGARVIAVTSGADRVVFCHNVGADEVVDRTSSDDLSEALKTAVGGSGANLVFDPVGGNVAAAAAGVLGRGGRHALIGSASGSWFEPKPLDMVLRNYSVAGVFAGGFTPTEDRSAYEALAGLLGEGSIKPPVGPIWSFKDVPAAIASLASAPSGKSVIQVRSDWTA